MLFVKLSSHKKVSAGAGCVSPQCSCRDYPTKSICRLTQPALRLLSFHEERPHLCFLRCHTFLCAVPRMGKAHSPNFLQEPCGLTQPAPEVPFLSKRKEPKIRQRGSVLFGFSSGGARPHLCFLRCPAFLCAETFCRKVTPLGNFAKRSSLPLSAPPAGEC